MSLLLLKRQANHGDTASLEKLGSIAKRSTDAYLDCLPSFIYHLSSSRLTTDSGHLDPIQSTQPHLLANIALSNIAQGASRTDWTTKSLQDALRKHWPQIWSSVSFLVDGYLKAFTSFESSRTMTPFQMSLHKTIGSLFSALTLPHRVADKILSTSGCVSCLLRLSWVQDLGSVDRPVTHDSSNWQSVIVALQSTQVSYSNQEWHQTLEDAFHWKTDRSFLLDVIGSFITCIQDGSCTRPAGLRTFTMVAAHFGMCIPSVKFQDESLCHRCIHWVMVGLRKIVSSLSPDEFIGSGLEAILCCCSTCLTYIVSMIESRFHLILIDALRNRLLQFMLQAIPFFFAPSSQASEVASDVHKPYFDIWDHIVRYATHWKLLKLLNHAIREIEKEGYELYLQNAPEHLKDYWTALKNTVIDRVRLRADFKDQVLQPCNWCHNPKPEKFYRCSGCLCDYYCSRECQKLSWKGHRAACQSLSAHKPFRILPFDAHDRLFANFIAQESIRLYQDEAATDERAYRAARSLSADLPLIHVHYLDAIPLRREIVTLDEARSSVAPEYSWDEFIAEQLSQSKELLFLVQLSGGPAKKYFCAFVV
ncbi:hypothetical protein D9758_016186 [Tetrapyrgos nigripes]|uniref:MYND-type domain-containing protein n=1 Tax=Tetrapyrgos nigripes TaxID=182062 RepID=A0A8H5C4F5_9AGAR|nr:hypothetical protein D9758_016186 [Tetrapyrgos nigripes]